MNLSHLRYFLAVAETGSITRGAERAFVAQPTLSAAIAKLEAELGTTLLRRRGRQTELTADGARFRQHAAEILRQVAEARRSLRAAPAATHFTLGVIDTVPFNTVSRLLADFVRATPSVEVELYQGSPAEVDRRLAQGRLSAAITLATDVGHGQRLLFRDRVVAAVPAGHDLTRKPALTAEDLHDAPLVVWTGLDGLQNVRRHLASRGVQPRVVLRTPHARDALDAVSAGLGLGFIHDAFPLDRARHLPVESLTLARSIVLALPDAPAGHVDAFAVFATSHAWRDAGLPDRFDIAH